MMVNLKGGMTHLTDQTDSAYRVKSGNVLVYILPYEEKKTGRRYLLYEAQKNDCIPSLCWENEKLGTWRFCLVALESAQLEQYVPEDMDAVKMEFAACMDVKLFSPEEFEEQMVEQFNINMIKEESGIYATALEQERSYEQSLQIVYDMFQKKTRVTKTEPSGNKTYDAVAKICDYMGIKMMPFELVRESCRRKITLYDIARLSHFTTRQIILEENWYKKDSGAILAYKRKGRTPIACIPKGPSKYVAYDVSDNREQTIDEAYAQTLEVQADMLYRPFPMEKINLKKLLQFGLRGVYKREIVNLLFLSLLGTLVGLLIPVINQQLYDKYIPMADQSGLVQMCMVVLACTLGNLGFTVVKNLATFRSMNSMEYAVQSATYDRLFSLPESFFREYESADLAQRVMGVTSIFQVMADVMLQTLLNVVFSVLYLVRMFQYSGKLSGIAFFMVLVIMLITGFVGYRQLKYEGELMELEGRISSILYQFLVGISKIRIAGIENRALLEYLKPYARARKLTMNKERMSVLVDTIIGASGVLFSIVLYFVMVKQSVSLSMGAFMGFMTAFGSFSGAMMGMVSSFMDVNNVIPAYKRCRPVLDTLPEFEEDTLLPGTLTGDIEVSNVDFAYNQESGLVLNELSFHVKAGEYIGIVGSSGCGKSTLMKLLLGFEKPQKGKIFYDGKDIDSMDKRELRKKFGVVLQDGDLISGSIYDNIIITAPNTTMKRVEQVVEEVGLKQDIEQMPMGLHTILSEDSGTISGGQKQRILIARAIVGKPKILYFDEATSALDNVTQSMVCQSLEKLNATRIVIAHRLSTVMNCDRIFVMDQGKIVEEGNYQQLMEKRGLFYQLASRQMA